jgi:hypothetical protein
MFCNFKTYRQHIALCLLGLFSFVLATQAIHVLLHQHEHEQTLCNETCDKKQVHFHELEHELDKCSLCEFTFSIAELPDILPLILRNEVAKYSYFLPFYEVGTSAELHNIFSRGPPDTL